jgi:hypothetical protein
MDGQSCVTINPRTLWIIDNHTRNAEIGELVSVLSVHFLLQDADIFRRAFAFERLGIRFLPQVLDVLFPLFLRVQHRRLFCRVELRQTRIHGEPLGSDDLVDLPPFPRVGFEQVSHQSLHLRADDVHHFRAELPLSVGLLFVQSFYVSVVERHRLVEHYVEDHPQGPDVGDLGVVRRALEDLGGGVRERAAVSVAGQAFAVGVGHVSGESKIGHFEIVVARDEGVFALQVSVSDLHVVQILHGEGQLAEPHSRLGPPRWTPSSR